MSIEDNNFDLRQLEAMRLQLTQFETRTITLSHLIAGLKALLASMRTFGKDWKETFESEWWTLEQVYAVALDRKKTELSPEEDALIKEATGKLRTVVSNALEQLEHVVAQSQI